MAQHEKCFAGSVLQGSCVLAWIAAGQLCILRGSNLNHPHTLQALLVNRIVGASAAPTVSHLKPLPHFTDFLWESRRQPRLPSVRKTPLATFGATFLERQKLKNFGQILKNASFGHNQAKFGQFCIFLGCGLPNSAAILRHSAAFCCNSVEAGATHRFLSRKVHFLASKKSKNGRFWQKNLREYFGFSAAIQRKILKGQNIHLPMVRIAFFSVLSAHPRSCRPFPPVNSDKFVFLAAW